MPIVAIYHDHGGRAHEGHGQAIGTRLADLPRAPGLMQEAKYGSHFAVETKRRKPANPDASRLRDRYPTPVYLLAGLFAHVEIVLALIPASYPALVVAEPKGVGLLVQQRLMVLSKRPNRSGLTVFEGGVPAKDGLVSVFRSK